jgi:hypothetical protein
MSELPPPEHPEAPYVPGAPNEGATPVLPVSPETPDTTASRIRAGAPELRGTAQRMALGVVAFVATLILLFGLANLLRSTGGAGPPASSSTASTSNPSSVVGSSSGATASVAAVPSGVVASPSASGDPVLVGAGDLAASGLAGEEATAALVDSIPGTVFTAGDNAYPDGTAAQFRDCYGPTWGRFLDRTRAAAGNHDWVTKGLAGYLGYFGAAGAPDGKSWYSYDLGTWHIVVLDSDCSSVGGCGADSAQGKWLAADLKGSTARCTLAIWHQPRFTSGEHGNDKEVAPFWRALYDAGADLVINGHDHDYERFAPQDPDARADREKGIREFVVGTGGAALRTFPKIAANSELRAAVAHGVIRLVLHRSSYEWTFIPTSGDFGDSGTAPCH